MNTSRVLEYAAEEFLRRVQKGELPSFDFCLHEALRVLCVEAKEEDPKHFFESAGRLGPWARRGAKGERYLMMTIISGDMIPRKIVEVGPHDGSWRYVEVRLEGEKDSFPQWCGKNTYTKE